MTAGGRVFLLIAGSSAVLLGGLATLLGPETGRQAMRRVPDADRGGMQSEWYWTFQAILLGVLAVLLGLGLILIAVAF